MLNDLKCKHGGLKYKCLVCELEEENAALKAQLNEWREDNDKQRARALAAEDALERAREALIAEVQIWLRAQPDNEQGADGGWYPVTGSDLANRLSLAALKPALAAPAACPLRLPGGRQERVPEAQARRDGGEVGTGDAGGGRCLGRRILCTAVCLVKLRSRGAEDAWRWQVSWGIKQNPIDGNWLLMDGDEPLLNFYQNEALAESVLMVIRWAVKEAEDQKAAAEREAIRVDGLHRDSLIAHNEAHLKTIEEAMALKSRALAAEAALADSHKNAQDLHSDNCRLALELDSAKSALEQAREALVWCSGSADFAVGGKARAGWLKICVPLLSAPAAEQAAPAAEKGEGK